MSLPVALHHDSRRRRSCGLFIALIVALMASVTISSSVATAQSELGALVEIDSANDDMNSTAVETSGVTYNADTHSLLTVDDEHNAYEFALNPDGTINEAITPRIIELDMGRNDFEGVAWLVAQTYAFLSEEDGEVVIATIPEADTNGETTIRTSDVQRSFPVITGNWGNLGPEGLATDGTSFFVAREMPATLSKFNFYGQFEASVDIASDVSDASGIAVLEDGTFLVVSHESRLIAHYDIDWEHETATLLATRSAASFTQLEGVTVMNGTDVYLFGEDNTRKGQPGQTYSHLHGTLIPPVISVSDVDCSGTVDIRDALIIARLQVGIFHMVPGCGSGDHDGDGTVDIGDALLIARCTVGIANIGCPDV